MLHGPGDLRVQQVPDPEGEVLVRVEAATACGTDVKMLRHGHRVLGPYPCRFGHETAGVRLDTGERVLVSDSVPCGACPPCEAGRPQICREPAWVLGGFAERIAAPATALHAVPAGLAPEGAAMAEPLAAAVHAVARGLQGAPRGEAPGSDAARVGASGHGGEASGRGRDAARAAVLGGGPMGLMLARLLVLEGRDVTVADPHAERRAQAEELGARSAEHLRDEPLVFEAVGRPEAWRAAVDAAAPGGVVVLVGGCPPGSDVGFPAAPLHYDELELRGAFHHSPAEVDRALALLASGEVDWRAFAGERIGLEDLAAALRDRRGGPATKLIVDPAR